MVNLRFTYPIEISVFSTTEGDLAEFDCPVPQVDPRMEQRFIQIPEKESKIGIRITVKTETAGFMHDAMLFDVFVDGNAVGRMALGRTSPKIPRLSSCFWGPMMPGQGVCSMMFQPIDVNRGGKGADGLTEMGRALLGTIVVKVHWGRSEQLAALRGLVQNLSWPFRPLSSIAENAIAEDKHVTHCVALLPPEKPDMTMKWTQSLVAEEEWPLGTVVFHYRTKASLEHMDVALRDPNPGEGPELDAREPSSLSRNDLYKLVVWYKSAVDIISDTEEEKSESNDTEVSFTLQSDEL